MAVIIIELPMKPSFFIGILFLFIISSGLAQTDIQEESKRFECVISTFNEHGLELNSKLNSVEEYLQITEQISRIPGSNYFDLYKQLSLNEDYLTVLPKELIQPLLKTLAPSEYFSPSCSQNFNTSDSSLLVNKLVIKMNNLIERKSEINSQEIAKILTSTLSEKDFQSPYFRFLAIMGIVNNSMEETPELLNKVLQQSVLSYPCPSYLVELTEENELLWDQKKYTEEELVKELKNKFLENPEDFCLTLKTWKKSMYANYLSFHEKIKDFYLDKRESISKELFDKTYSSLNLQDRIKIEKQIPIRFNVIIGDE